MYILLFRLLYPFAGLPTMKKTIALLFLFTLPCKAYGIDPGHFFQLRTGTDINATTESRLLTEVRYELTLEENWQLAAGYHLANGQNIISGYHLEAAYSKLFFPELSARMKLLNKAYHSFDIGENSIIPYLRWKSKNFEADFGVTFRYTNFNDGNIHSIFIYPDELVQSVLLYRLAGYFNLDDKGSRLGVELKNHDLSYAANTFAFSLNLDALYHVTSEWDIMFNIGAYPDGLSGISIELNRFLLLLGVQYHI